MSDLLESLLRVGMTVFIVGPLIAWVARRGARERSEATDSLDRFTVRMPAAVRVVIACCAVAFELIMLGVYVWQGVSLGEWDHELVWFGHAMALAGMSIWALLSIPRLDVDGDRVVSRNVFGARRETTFSNITRATLHAQMMRIDLFEGERKFCSISLEGVCSLNLIARLEEEGIEIFDAVERPMTKVGLCWAAIKPLTIVFNGMALVFSLVIAFMALFTDEGMRLLVLVPFLFLFIGVALPLFMLSMPARGILEIGRQERELGFSFAEEMAGRGATVTGSSRSATLAWWHSAATTSRRSRRMRGARAGTAARSRQRTAVSSRSTLPGAPSRTCAAGSRTARGRGMRWAVPERPWRRSDRFSEGVPGRSRSKAPTVTSRRTRPWRCAGCSEAARRFRGNRARGRARQRRRGRGASRGRASRNRPFVQIPRPRR